jgi:hypothetical protein
MAEVSRQALRLPLRLLLIENASDYALSDGSAHHWSKRRGLKAVI